MKGIGIKSVGKFRGTKTFNACTFKCNSDIIYCGFVYQFSVLNNTIKCRSDFYYDGTYNVNIKSQNVSHVASPTYDVECSDDYDTFYIEIDLSGSQYNDTIDNVKFKWNLYYDNNYFYNCDRNSFQYLSGKIVDDVNEK